MAKPQSHPNLESFSGYDVSQKSVEELHHFSCKDCKKWWSIGDAPSEKDKWYCPWCGVLNNYGKNNGGKS